MKTLFSILFASIFLFSCSSSKISRDKNTEFATNETLTDTIKIANDQLEYEIIIIDPGFSSWLASRAKPRKYYTQNYLQTRNSVWVKQWNMNVNNPSGNKNMYEMSINYDDRIDYGYEVNYLLFNYLTYFQLTNNVRLGGFEPRN